MKKFIVSIMFVLLAGTFAAKALAQTSVAVYLDNNFSTACLSASSPGNVTFGGDCGDINFDSPNFDCFFGGSCPTVTAQNAGITQQLILNNTVITNNSSSAFHTVTITYTGDFLDIYTSELNYYGLSASGNFFRPPFDLASFDSFNMTSWVTYVYFDDQGQHDQTHQIGYLQYPSNGSLPTFGSVSLNDFTPQDPAQVIQPIMCSSSNGPCGAGETITTTLNVVLGPNDTISILGSAHSPATGCKIIVHDTDGDPGDRNDLNETGDGEGFSFVDPSCANTTPNVVKLSKKTDFVTTLSSLTATIDVKPGQSIPFVQPNDKGTLEVTLYGQTSATIDTVDIPGLDVTKVDLSTVRFGPNCATILTPDEKGCHAKVVKSQFKDDNKDRVQDVRLSFNNGEVGWNLKCFPLQTTGTLVGKFQNGNDFSATAPVVCH